MTGRWYVLVAALIFVPIVLLFSNSLALAEPSTIVDIKNGTLEGTIMQSRKGREFVAFRGIPYAQPPLGELRFKPPKPFDSWLGVRSAKEDANICIQSGFYSNQEGVVGDEDCLYLNVYTPKLPSNEIDAVWTSYPVMIWFHGGGWVTGAGHSEVYGPKFLLDHDVVLVTVNYRLGPLGFLSTEDRVVPGNQALKDQTQSIKWVNENIAVFGGDPNSVTLFGQSAGGGSVHYHMISPLSRGLFHRGISQSGTALGSWAFHKPGTARIKANKLGQLLDCPTNTSSALVDCLMKKDAADIMALDRTFQDFGFVSLMPFRPVIEPDQPGAFLIEEPIQAVRSGKIADIPWMTGVTEDEGAIESSNVYESEDKGAIQKLDQMFMELGPTILLYGATCPEKSWNDVTRQIRKFYFGNKTIDESTRKELTDLYSDVWIFISGHNTVREHFEALSSPIYYYLFAYKGSFSNIKVSEHTEIDWGVSHGNELFHLFSMSAIENSNKRRNAEDENMIDLMTKLWTNFAKSGNPTPEETPEIPVKWIPVRTANLEYLRIENSKNLQMSANLFPDRVNFWASIPYRDDFKSTYDDHRTYDEL